MIMHRRRWMIRGLLGGLGWACLGLGLAQAGVVLPIKSDLTLDTTANVPTVSLYQLDSTLPAAAAVTQQSPSQCTTSGTSFYKDVTDCWLPEWNPDPDPAKRGKSVYVVINVINGPAGAPALVQPTTTLAPGAGTNPFLASLTTSAYPGKCTNLGLATDADYAGADFTLDLTSVTLPTSATTSVTGYKLTPNDCGGIAVIQVGSLKFLLPKDGSATVPANGLPDVWESLYGGTLDPTTVIDIGPAAASHTGDGMSIYEEYRGFIVSGKQIRTDPTKRDLFVYVVNLSDCSASPSPCPPSPTSYYTIYPVPTAPSATLTVPAMAATPIVPGTPPVIATFTTSPPTTSVFSNAHVQGEIIGNVSGRARIVAVTAPTSATAEITQAFPPSTTSLSQGAWKVRESLFALVYNLVAPERLHLLGPDPTNPLKTNEWVDNFVSLRPSQTLTISDSITDRTVNSNRLYGPAQKGVRVMEALNINSPSVLGWSFGVASPNEAGNVVVFTQRIINYITGLFGSATLKYSTASLVNGVWTWSKPPILVPDGDPTTVQDGVATSLGVRNFILSKAFQFYTGHEILHSLDLTLGTQGTIGHHFAAGTGDCLDSAITTTSKSGTVTFNIPSICGTADQAQFLIE